MSKANQIFGQIFKGLVRQYERIVVRLMVTCVAITIAFFYWRIANVQGQPTDYVYFEKLWLSCAYGISGIVTGVLFTNLHFNNQSENVKNVGILGFIIFGCLIFVTYYSLSHGLPKWFPLVVAIAIFFYDFLLADAGLQRLKESNWMEFDLGIVVGIFIVFVLQETLTGLSPETRCVFSGGGTSFQLIMANMVFDPRNYQ